MRIAWIVAVAAVLHSAPATAEPDRCASGLERADGRPVLAYLDLEACIASGRGGGPHRAAHRRIKRELDGGELALITFATDPDGVAVRIEPLGAVAATGRAYLPPGRYILEVDHPGYRPLTRPLEITGRYREIVELVLSSDTETARAGRVDFTGDAPGATEVVRGKDPEHENLLPERYRQGRPTGPGGDRDVERSRWPYALVGIGIAAVAAGFALDLADRDRAALGLYIGGGAGIAWGVTGLVLRW